MKKGFTLIEVLFAITLLGLAVAPLLGGLTRSLLISVSNERRMRAVFLAQQLVEGAKSKAIINFPDNDPEAGNNLEEGAFPEPDQRFKYKIEYVDSLGDDPDKIKTIQVEVWYDENDGDNGNSEEEKVKLFAKVAKRS